MPTPSPLQRLHARAKRTAAQDLLGFQLTVAGVRYESEYHWDTKTKRRADFALMAVSGQVWLVEVDGGLFVNGGHTRGAARERDYERDAEAMMLGFRVLRVSPRQVKQGKALLWIQKLLK